MKFASSLSRLLAVAAVALAIPAMAGGDVYVRPGNAPTIYAHLGTAALGRGVGDSRDWSMEAVAAEVGYAGYPYWLYVEATSKFTQTIKFGATNRPAGAVIEVFDAQGKPVPMTAEGHATFDKKTRDWGHAKYSVTPGSVVGIALNLARHFDLSQPGKYSVVVHLAPDYAGAEDMVTHTKAFIFTLLEPSQELNETSQGR